MGGLPLPNSRNEEVGLLDNDSFVENSGKEINTYENATMKMKLPVLRVLLVLSIVLNVATFFVSLSDMTPVVWISIIVFVVLLAIYTSIRGKQLEAKKVI